MSIQDCLDLPAVVLVLNLAKAGSLGPGAHRSCDPVGPEAHVDLVAQQDYPRYSGILIRQDSKLDYVMRFIGVRGG